MSKPYSLSNPPSAPKKNTLVGRKMRLERIPRLRFDGEDWLRKEKGRALTERRALLNLPANTTPEEEEEEEERQPEWRILAESGRVRSKFLLWTPEDVLQMDNVDELETLQTLFTPASQAWNAFEEAYCDLIVEAIKDRLRDL